ncbi:UNVERIFIED_CONTAM: ComF family protein [Acetivibrio alkalicellulosi]
MLIKWFLNLLFPPRCIFCNKILNFKSEICICNDCPSKIPFVQDNEIQETKGYYDELICLCSYRGIIKDAIIRFKFFNKSSYHKVFAILLAERIQKTKNVKEIDYIVSVPLHQLKEQARGYNQSYLISSELSRLTGIKEGSYLLKRIKNTKSQSLLHKYKRAINVKEAFKVTNQIDVEDKTILLLDDILTTGNTLNECSRVLKEAGAKKIIVVVLATGRKL